MFSAFRTDFSTLFLKVSIPSWGRVKAKQGYSVAVWKNPNPGYSLLKSKRYMLRLFSQCLGKELKCRKFQLPLLFLQRLSSRSLKDNKLTQKPCISKRQKVQSCGYSTPHIFMIGEICLKYGSRKHSVRAKVKVHFKPSSRSHYDIAYLHPPNNVSTKYGLPPPYDFQDVAWTRF